MLTLLRLISRNLSASLIFTGSNLLKTDTFLEWSFHSKGFSVSGVQIPPDWPVQIRPDRGVQMRPDYPVQMWPDWGVQIRPEYSILLTNGTISMNTKAFALGISHPVACAFSERGRP
jgi:hypothetical protein